MQKGFTLKSIVVFTRDSTGDAPTLLALGVYALESNPAAKAQSGALFCAFSLRSAHYAPQKSRKLSSPRPFSPRAVLPRRLLALSFSPSSLLCSIPADTLTQIKS